MLEIQIHAVQCWWAVTSSNSASHSSLREVTLLAHQHTQVSSGQVTHQSDIHMDHRAQAVLLDRHHAVQNSPGLGRKQQGSEHRYPKP